MKIEVLYVPGCPNHPRVLEQLRQVLATEGLTAEICETPVEDQATAEALQFPGSPTVRVDGADIVASAPRGFGLSCRLYDHARGTLGVPPDEAIRRALTASRDAL